MGFISLNSKRLTRSNMSELLCFILLMLPNYSLSSEDQDERSGYVAGASSSQNINVDIAILKDLLNDTLNGYDVRIRPRFNQSSAVVVNITFLPNSVVTLDTTAQRLDLLGYFRIEWEDEIIRWDPADYNGLNTLKIPITQLWRPRIIILKAFEGNEGVGNDKVDVVKISANASLNSASVVWVPEGIYSVLCDLDVAFYPFDIQTCHFQYYASDESIEAVYLSGSNEVRTDEYVENSEWKLLSVTSGSYVSYGTNIIYVTFEMERRAQFTLYTIMIPLLLLSILDVLGFLIPVESGEKISYMITIFLTFGFFIFILRDGLPHNSLHMSYFLLYIILLSFVSLMSVSYAIIQTRLHQYKGDEDFNLLQFLRKYNAVTSADEAGRTDKATRKKTDKVVTAERGLKKNVKSANETSRKEHTKSMEKAIKWSDVLQTADYVLFVIFSTLVLIFTTYFFATVSAR